MFDRPTISRPEGHPVVWAFAVAARRTPHVGTLLALDHIGRDVDLPLQHRQRSEGSRPQRRRLVVVEAWQLTRDGEAPVPVPHVQGGPQTQSRLVDGCPGRGRRPRHRARCCGGVEPATQVALRQAAQAIDAVGDAFGLTAGKRRKLLGARIGQRLLIAGTTGPRSRRCPRQRRTGCVRQIPGSTILRLRQPQLKDLSPKFAAVGAPVRRLEDQWARGQDRSGRRLKRRALAVEAARVDSSSRDSRDGYSIAAFTTQDVTRGWPSRSARPVDHRRT
jgi:hypothetical protein